ncbi:hypothetical protein CYANOKiyG1_49610 [Okeania sp. KiyG1]|nr:hypothetical protein CYANOKiyG1_49610 [Okeania sp. KiyG1]
MSTDKKKGMNYMKELIAGLNMRWINLITEVFLKQKKSEQNLTLEVTTDPQQASKKTELSLTTDNAIFLNGVKLDLLSAGCYGVGDGKIGYWITPTLLE